MEVLLPILVVVVAVFGFGVLFVSRYRDGRNRVDLEPPPRSAVDTLPRGAAIAEPDVAEPDVAEPDVAEPDVAEPDVVEPDVVEAEVVEAELVEAGVIEPEVVERPRFRDRLTKARSTLAAAFTGVRGRAKIDDDTWDDLEEALLRSDVGMGVTTDLLGGVRDRVASREITEANGLLDALKVDMLARLHRTDAAHRQLNFEELPSGSPNVWLFVGVNGVGKTTTVGKVGAQQSAEGRSVVMAAGDTFRAAAAEQLGTWADRSGADLVRGAEGGDPSSVIFDAVQRAAARGVDLVLADTAGRLHTKTNLMDELRKVRRVADKEPGRVTEVLLVIDATTGQNGLTQAKEFTDATDVTGVVLTKLDGSAKGGIVFAIETELGIPVKLVGLGETIGDLVPFDPEEFIDALFAD